MGNGEFCGSELRANACRLEIVSADVFVMDWNFVEGNWKQLKGKVKEQGAALPTKISTSLPAGKTNSKDQAKKG